MIIYAHIHQVTDGGDRLVIKAQGRQLGSGENGPWLSFEIEGPATPAARKSYHTGRQIMIEVTPK